MQHIEDIQDYKKNTWSHVTDKNVTEEQLTFAANILFIQKMALPTLCYNVMNNTKKRYHITCNILFVRPLYKVIPGIIFQVL